MPVDMSALNRVAERYPIINKALEIILRDHVYLINQKTSSSAEVQVRILYNDEGIPISVEDMGKEKHILKKGIPRQ